MQARRGRTRRRSGAETHAALRKGSPKLPAIGPAGIHQVGLQNPIPGLQEIRVGRREVHPVSNQLQDEVVANRVSALMDEGGARLPQSDAPNFTHVVDLVGRAAYDRI